MEKVVRTYGAGRHISISAKEKDKLKQETVKTKFNKALINIHAMEYGILGNVGITYNRIAPSNTRMEYEFLILELQKKLASL